MGSRLLGIIGWILSLSGILMLGIGVGSYSDPIFDRIAITGFICQMAGLLILVARDVLNRKPR